MTLLSDVRGPESVAVGVADESWRGLFHRTAIQSISLRPGQQCLSTRIHGADGRLFGGISGVRDGTVVEAGLDLVSSRATPAVVATVLRRSLEKLGAQGVREVELHLPPACHSDNEPLVQFTVLNEGFTVRSCELNQHLDLSHLRSPRQWVDELRRPARSALDRLHAKDLQVREVRGRAEWEAGRQLLHGGADLVLSWDDLAGARAPLAPHVRMVCVFRRGAPIAAALVYRVRPAVELVAAWGESDHRLAHSPLVLLAAELVEQALRQGVQTIDLGQVSDVAAVAGEAAERGHGSAQLARSLSAREQPRLTVATTLAA
ncbi:GNAT family N-acetyltransferase [Rhodococcus sp. X156]|uniref:GNAT family N-acetyltransferase n=1 Tax=Rhodococcus sp. X156 TaxID=2499145 RepID=UPI000FDC485F|nr:GNAT family N-acetyltransferase [Rhodococcus sp. X156]